jgi:hypothetical protein
MGTNGKLEHTYICWKIKNIQNENRKFIYLKNSFILGLLSLASVVKENFG